MKDVFGAYLGRLGVVALPAPDLATLTDLMVRHMQTVPFENLDVMAGTPRALSTDAALQKVAVHARGGFCYELNEAFRALLEELGFTVRRIEARVWQAKAQRFGAPFDHLALVVSLLEGEFLVDVGYGDSNRVPMRLPQDQARDVSGEYSLAAVREGYLCLSSKSQPLYEMTLDEQPLQAFAPMCRYHQNSPESVFSTGLICTRATGTGRITLSRDRLIIVDGERRTETLTTNVSAALNEHFGISVC
ncbi:MAG: nhoA [Gammaproteobacteria bacterium]|nr:nhoA [Gammaproteobacteria bacterium]